MIFLITHILPNGMLLRRVMSKPVAEDYLDAIENNRSDWILLELTEVDTFLIDTFCGVNQ